VPARDRAPRRTRERSRELVPVRIAAGGIVVVAALVVAPVAPRPEAQSGERCSDDTGQGPVRAVEHEQGGEQRPDADPADQERGQ